jgi:hypothetical protein
MTHCVDFPTAHEDRSRHTGSARYSTIEWSVRIRPLEGGTMQKNEVPSWVAHMLTPPEVIAAYVDRRINDPSLLSGVQTEPTYADFLRGE